MLGWILGVVAVFIVLGYLRMPIIGWTVGGGLLAAWLSAIAGFGFAANVVLFGAFAAVALAFNVPPLRRALITNHVLAVYRRILPDMSQTEKEAIDAGKLLHIDLNGQKPGRYDQDYRFGAEDIKANFFLVKMLEDSGYEGMRHFDAHAYRTEDEVGVWDFAAGCMRTYMILKEKAERWNNDAEIQGLLKTINQQDERLSKLVAKYTPENAQKLLGISLDRKALADAPLPYEKRFEVVSELLGGSDTLLAAPLTFAPRDGRATTCAMRSITTLNCELYMVPVPFNFVPSATHAYDAYT